MLVTLMGQRFKELVEWLCVTPFQQQNMVLNCLFALFSNVLLFPTKKILPNLFSKMEMVIMFLLVEINFKFIWKWTMKGITSQKKVWIPSDYSELKLWEIWLWNSQALSNLNNRKTEKFRFCIELYMTIEDPLK